MSKNSSTIAEIFIVLTLVFVIQSVVKFSISVATDEKTEEFGYSLLLVQQEPTEGDRSDHIRYIVVGSDILLFDVGVVNANDPSNYKSSIGASGECRTLDTQSYSPIRYIANEDSFRKRTKAFSNHVRRIYNISLDISRVDSQIAVSASYMARELESDVTIVVGFCLCRLPNLAHPLLWETVTVGRDFRTSNGQVQFSKHQWEGAPPRLMASVDPRGVLFTSPKCEIEANLFDETIRECAWLLKSNGEVSLEESR